MLLLWPLVTLVLFRRLAVDRALIWTVLAGYLLLPPVVAINLPVVPDLTKDSIPALSAAAFVLFALRDRIPVLPDALIGKGLMVLFVLSPFATVLTNADPIAKPNGDLQGMRIYDSVAAVTNQAIAVLPFFLGRRFLASDGAMRALLVAFMLSGLAYSLPMLIEMRLSPQINVWVYGFFQHDFFQTIRFGGYRPVVFLPHGLWVAFFAMMAAISAAVLWRIGPAEARPKLTLAALYLVAILVLCKSAGPLVYAVGLLPLVLLAPRRLQVAIAAGLALVVITYPLLRGAHLVPLDAILDTAMGFDANRASSLEFRIINEENLLDRAAERPWFGWGGYGRNLIYDPITGSGISIADGAWIITLGIYGWLGYIAQFGLLVLPLILLAREAMAQGAEISRPVAGVSLLLAANMVDLLPNATLVPLTWLMAGALLGHAEAMARDRRAVAPAAPLQRRTVL